MKKFTGDDVRRKSSEVFNEVQKNKKAQINHRDRPEMVLILRDHYDYLRSSGNKGGAK